MRRIPKWLSLILLAGASGVSAAQISGDYLEARTCDVYTGPCFANAEMDLTGKEAVMAWKVTDGTWNGVSLEGLSVAVVATSEKTMGASRYFKMHAGKIASVILVDERATPLQREALIEFAKNSAKEYTSDVKKIVDTPMAMTNDSNSGKAKFQAGELAIIETRGLKKLDCVCSNEEMFYNPLTRISNVSPAYASTLSFTGDGFDRTWTTHGQRSAFLGTFRR